MDFEIHITVKDLKMEEKESFVEFCKSEGLKPVMIVLDKGNYINQPMITAPIKCSDFDEAKKEVEKMANKLRNEGFIVVRKKMEVSPKEESYFHTPVIENSKPYFEWHGKVQVNDVDRLKSLCEGHGGHISRNSLKTDGTLRFVTVRNYEGSKEFYEQVENIHHILKENEIELLKQEYELCIYDNKEELDSGWIG